MDHRVVSPIELYAVPLNNINFYKTVVFHVRFQTSSFSLPEWKLRIEKALRLTIQAQPRLRLQIDLSRKQPYFIILPISVFDTLPVRIIERTNDDEDNEFLDKTVEDESNMAFVFDPNSPLWRITLIVSSGSNIFDMILTINHAIGDGISGMAFFTSFIECLSEKTTPTFSLNNDRSSHELIPSNSPSSSSSFLSKIIEKIPIPNFLSQYFFPKTYWTGNTQLIGDEPFQTRLVSFELSPTILHSLHKKCRNEQTTIHTALLSSLLLSITDVFGKRNMEFRCGTAVNIRRFCQPIISNQQMGVFVSAVGSYHYIPYRQNLVDLFWRLARQIKEQINEEIEQAASPMIESMESISDWEEVLKTERKTLPNGYENSVDISNLLRWSFGSNDSSWKILHGGFTQSASIIGSAFTVNVVTINDILKVYICFQEHSFQNMEEVKLMRDRMKQFLMDSISL
jgi:hypothetical protein